jgi:hypothetical protein
MQQGHLCDFVPSQNQDKTGNHLGSAWLTYGDVLSARRFTSFARSLLGASSLIVVLLRCFSMKMFYVQYSWVKFGGYAHVACYLKEPKSRLSRIRITSSQLPI